jgi:hypothetical protein
MNNWELLELFLVSALATSFFVMDSQQIYACMLSLFHEYLIQLQN